MNLQSSWWRGLLLVLLLAAIAAFFVAGLQHELSLAALKLRQVELAAFQVAHPLLLAGLYFVFYVLVTALSLPGAAVMTLAGGVLFGLLEGTVLVSFASTFGATLAFLSSRFLFRAAVQRRFGERLQIIDAGVKREGALYLFGLRLVPLFPFFAINLLLGLTSMRVRTFYWVSQLGMLSMTLVYVNAGTRLANIHSLSGMLSPGLLLSLVLVGVFPILARWVVVRIKIHQRYAQWPRPRHYDRNLIVIGAGAAGLVSAYMGASLRAKVSLVEGQRMGGDCLNTGCIPSKTLIRSARAAAELRRSASLGLRSGLLEVDFPAVMQRVHEAIKSVAPHDSVERYRSLGVDVRSGQAKIVSPWAVKIGDETLTTRSIIIATGATPATPDLPGLEDVGYLTSDTLWSLRELPQRLLILGGGPIGCELAQAFARLGTAVTLLQRPARLLPREDDEVSAGVRECLEADGVVVHTACDIQKVSSEPDGKTLHGHDADGPLVLSGDEILVAVGRKPRLQGYGLEELGIPVERFIETNSYLQTLYPNILACGDVAGPYQYTHAAAHQAWYAAVNALFGRLRRFRVDYSVLPNVTFVDPEVARVGLNERTARLQGIPFEISRYNLRDLDRAITEGVAQGFIKVLTPPGKDRILGVTIVAEHAGELLAEFTLAMRHGLGLGKILATIHAYPTWSEANKYTAGVWRKAHVPEALLRWVARYHSWRRRGGRNDSTDAYDAEQ